MAKIPSGRRISREDIPEAPGWIVRLLSPINTFFDAVYNALNGQLTFVENIKSQIRTVSFTTASDYTSGNFPAVKFPNLLKTRVSGLLLLQVQLESDNFTPLTSAVSVDWREVNQEVVINYVSGLANSNTYLAKVLVF